MSKEFKRRDASKLKRLGDKWRRPKSRRSWTRVKARGKPRIVEVGYRTPKKERGKINGKIPVMIYGIKDIEKIDPSKNIAIISGQIGKKNRKIIEEECKKKGIEIYN